MRPFLPPVDAPDYDDAPGPQCAAVWLALLLLDAAFWCALVWGLYRLWAEYGH